MLSSNACQQPALHDLCNGVQSDICCRLICCCVCCCVQKHTHTHICIYLIASAAATDPNEKDRCAKTTDTPSCTHTCPHVMLFFFHNTKENIVPLRSDAQLLIKLVRSLVAKLVFFFQKLFSMCGGISRIFRI